MNTAAVDKAVSSTGFSGNVSVHQNGTITYSRVQGWADRANQIPNQQSTRFAIASGTKLLTALAIGRLIDDGKMDLETRLADILSGEFPEYDESISIQHLLNHTSGVPDYYDEELIDDYDNFTVSIPWNQLRCPSDYIPVLPRTEMKFSPGAKFAYNNSGYILLGICIERVTGKEYASFVEDEIMKPAGMADSGFFEFDRLPGNCANGYIEDGDSWRTNIYALPAKGASDGGVFTTTLDVYRLWRALFSGSVISDPLVKTFLQPFVDAPSEGKNISYGHGIWLRKVGDAYIPYFVGCDAGVSFKSWLYPQRDIVCTVMSNTGNGVWPVADALSRIMDETAST